MKYADDLVLLAKEETALESMTDRLTEIGKCYGMEMNVEKSQYNENLKETMHSTDDRSEKIRECGIFQLFG